MCWITFKKNGELPEKKKAEADVKCYKMLDADYSSPYMNKRYVVGEANEKADLECSRWPSSSGPVGYDEYRIYKGYHSIADEYSARCFYGSFMEYEKYCFYNAYGPYDEEDEEMEQEGRRMIIVECVIPAGSYYYVNETSEIVSDMIIIGRDVTGEIINR